MIHNFIIRQEILKLLLMDVLIGGAPTKQLLWIIELLQMKKDIHKIAYSSKDTKQSGNHLLI